MTKQVTEQEWREKAANLTKWREKRTSPPNLDLYKKIVSMVHVGELVLDVGCGQRHLEKCLPSSVKKYIGVDPFPLDRRTLKICAEELQMIDLYSKYNTSFMMSALDNVKDLRQSLEGLKKSADENIVILTGIGIEPDQYHTHRIDRADLVAVLGEPYQEVEMAPKLWLFEFKM